MSTQTCTGYKIHTDNAHSHCQCDKYRFSPGVDYSQRTSRRHPRPLQAAPTSQKQGSNERGQTGAVLTGGTRSRGKGEKKLKLTDGRKGTKDRTSGRELATSWLSMLLIEFPLGDAALVIEPQTLAYQSIYPLTSPACACLDVLKLKNNYTATDIVCLKVCRTKKPVIMRSVCLLLLVTKLNMSMAQAGKPIDRIHRTTIKWKHLSTGDVC